MGKVSLQRAKRAKFHSKIFIYVCIPENSAEAAASLPPTGIHLFFRFSLNSFSTSPRPFLTLPPPFFYFAYSTAKGECNFCVNNAINSNRTKQQNVWHWQTRPKPKARGVAGSGWCRKEKRVEKRKSRAASIAQERAEIIMKMLLRLFAYSLLKLVLVERCKFTRNYCE